MSSIIRVLQFMGVCLVRCFRVLSNIDKAIAFEWIAEEINKEQFEISFILLHHEKPFLYTWLKERKIQVHYIQHFGKKSYPKSFIKVYNTLLKIKPKVIHTHLFDANLIGLFAGKLLKIKKRIYTRHHSTYHHNNFPKAVKYDKWSNNMATEVVAISNNVQSVLNQLEKVPLKKIKLIPHGFDLKSFANVSPSAIDDLKQKYKRNTKINQLV